MKKKIIVLDFVSAITYVIPWDMGIFEDAEDCIEAYSEEFELGLSINNCEWMTTDEFILKVI